MTDKEFYHTQKRYSSLFPISLIAILLFIFILYDNNDDVMKFELIILFNVICLFIPLALIPFVERPFKLQNKADKGLVLFLMYLFILCIQMFLINIQTLQEQYKTILFAIVAGLYGAVIARYLTYPLEIIEQSIGIKNEDKLKK
ncbi:hypothetical protein MZA89_02020 [Haemophilus influenzae]|uniref:hypothetical protein n=2 Tax=Haemophilus influenzae TaxID=727 RepID=UPI0011B20900|nr:hypothetical protein [Haemophilus influenzae]MCK9109486.1 hypothetical protein [Haemophilus influenzae]NXZ83838.1 hypothetical protein [Haemophilus influenzae]